MCDLHDARVAQANASHMRIRWLRCSAIGTISLAAVVATAPAAAANTSGDIVVTEMNARQVLVAFYDVVEVNDPPGHCEQQPINGTATEATVFNGTTTSLTVDLADGCVTR